MLGHIFTKKIIFGMILNKTGCASFNMDVQNGICCLGYCWILSSSIM